MAGTTVINRNYQNLQCFELISKSGNLSSGFEITETALKQDTLQGRFQSLIDWHVFPRQGEIKLADALLAIRHSWRRLQSQVLQGLLVFSGMDFLDHLADRQAMIAMFIPVPGSAKDTANDRALFVYRTGTHQTIQGAALVVVTGKPE